MSAVRWKLRAVLDSHGLTAYALAQASGIQRMSTVYRLAKVGEEPSRVDLTTLAAVLDGLRQLTGHEYSVGDILEYVPSDDVQDPGELPGA